MSGGDPPTAPLSEFGIGIVGVGDQAKPVAGALVSAAATSATRAENPAWARARRGGTFASFLAGPARGDGRWGAGGLGSVGASSRRFVEGARRMAGRRGPRGPLQGGASWRRSAAKRSDGGAGALTGPTSAILGCVAPPSSTPGLGLGGGVSTYGRWDTVVRTGVTERGARWCGKWVGRGGYEIFEVGRILGWGVRRCARASGPAPLASFQSRE